MMADRLYVVENEESMTIVRAVSEARALQHVVKSQYKVRKATPDDVADYMGQGGQIEQAHIGGTQDTDAIPPEAGGGEE
jgi:hypothetical protein